MTAAKAREDAELTERAEAIAGWAEGVASVVTDLAELVSEHAETIAGWTLRLRRNVRS